MSRLVLSEEARAIADSAHEFAEGSGGVTRARKLRDNWPQRDTHIWKEMAELGWLGLVVPEEKGGLGLGVGDMCMLLESVGKSLVPEPLVPVMAAANVLAACDGDAAQQVRDALLAGDAQVIAVVARVESFPIQLQRVADCHEDVRLIVARGAGAQCEARLVSLDTPEISLTKLEAVDGSVLTDVMIPQDVWNASPVLGSGDAIEQALDAAHDCMLLGYSAYLVGVMEASLKMAVEYMKIRTQFGTAIGTFQALQHRAASCHVDLLATRALLYEACAAFETDKRAAAASAVKARASAAAMRIVKECVQFHGAIGFADEHDIGLFFRKAMSFGARLGGAMEHHYRYAEKVSA